MPWQWGTTGVTVNTSVYSGDPNTSAIFLDPPAELIGKINVVPEMGDVMFLAIAYEGGQYCTDDKVLLKKVRDKLVEAKAKWLSFDYGAVDGLGTDHQRSVFGSDPSRRLRIYDRRVDPSSARRGRPDRRRRHD